MKKLIFFTAWTIILIGCNNNTTQDKHTLSVITIDTKDVAYSTNVSDLFDQNIEIIKLETNDQCFVGVKNKKIVKNEYILISDETSQKISMFDRAGKYIKSIGIQGRGPGEYVGLGDFLIIGDSVYVQDKWQQKIIIYPLGDGMFREIKIEDPPIYFEEFFTREDKLYFVTNYPAGEKYYNLVSFDLNDFSRNYFVSFDKKISQDNQGWGLNKYAGQYRDTTLIIYSRDNNIYNVSESGVYPQYCMDFIRNKLPDDLMQKNGTEILLAALKKGYNTGLDQINNSRDYILGSFSEGNRSYDFIYGKKDGDVRLGGALAMQDWGGLPILNYCTTDRDELIMAYDALFFMQLWQKMLSVNDFEDGSVKNKFKTIYESSREDDNPIIVISRFKMN